MKRLFTLTTFVLSFVILLNSQNVANGGFELWTGGEPDEWTTSNVSSIQTITQTDDSHSGSWALRGQTNTEGTIVPEIVSGYDNFGIPVSQRYEKLKLHYKYFEAGSDKMIITLSIADENYANLGGGSLEIEDEKTNYTAVEIPISYSSPGTAAHAIIQIVLVDGFGSGPPDPDTYFIIDDLEFSGGSASLDEFTEVSLRVFPNPATDVINIEAATKVDRVHIMNTVGQLVYSKIVDHESVMIDLSNFESGLYLMQIEASGDRITRKIIVE